MPDEQRLFPSVIFLMHATFVCNAQGCTRPCVCLHACVCTRRKRGKRAGSKKKIKRKKEHAGSRAKSAFLSEKVGHYRRKYNRSGKSSGNKRRARLGAKSTGDSWTRGTKFFKYFFCHIIIIYIVRFYQWLWQFFIRCAEFNGNLSKTLGVGPKFEKIFVLLLLSRFPSFISISTTNNFLSEKNDDPFSSKYGENNRYRL